MYAEGGILGLDWRERCRNTAEVISVAMDVGLPMYFTQLEQVFNQYEAYSVEKLLLEPSGSSSLTAKKESASDTTPVLAKQGEPQGSSLTRKDKTSHGDLTKWSSETHSDGASSENRPQIVKPKEEARAMLGHSVDEICSKLKLKSFFGQRDNSAEMKLMELFTATQSNTAKENLLLSLR